MRFLVDRCAGRRLAEWLRSQGHDVLEARELGPNPGDRALLERAVVAQAWTQERVNFQGKHYQFTDVPVRRQYERLSPVFSPTTMKYGSKVPVRKRQTAVKRSLLPSIARSLLRGRIASSG